jgi:hypothetical protein
MNVQLALNLQELKREERIGVEMILNRLYVNEKIHQRNVQCEDLKLLLQHEMKSVNELLPHHKNVKRKEDVETPLQAQALLQGPIPPLIVRKSHVKAYCYTFLLIIV